MVQVGILSDVSFLFLSIGENKVFLLSFVSSKHSVILNCALKKKKKKLPCVQFKVVLIY